MAEKPESKTERLTLALTPTEMRAAEFVARIHPDRFDGVSAVLRDYSLGQCLEAYRLAREAVPA